MTDNIKLPPYPDGLCLREDIEDYAREAVRLNVKGVPDERKAFDQWWASVPIHRPLAHLDAWAAWQARAAISSSPAAPQPAQQGDARVTLPDDIERMAVNRYRPVPSGVLAYKVVGGDGDRILFFGTKGECQSVARELTEAFLDGAHVALAAQAQEAAPAAQQKGAKND